MNVVFLEGVGGGCCNFGNQVYNHHNGPIRNQCNHLYEGENGIRVSIPCDCSLELYFLVQRKANLCGKMITIQFAADETSVINRC